MTKTKQQLVELHKEVGLNGDEARELRTLLRQQEGPWEEGDGELFEMCNFTLALWSREIKKPIEILN